MRQLQQMRQTQRHHDTLDTEGIARVNNKVLTKGPVLRVSADRIRMRYTLNRLERSREGVHVLPGTLLHSQWLCLRPERVTLSPLESALKPFEKFMQEGGGIEPHRAGTRLTAYKVVSTPNGLRLPHSELTAPARIELATSPLRVGRSFHLSYGAVGYTVVHMQKAGHCECPAEG